MPQCVHCRFEGPYDIRKTDQHHTYVRTLPSGQVEMTEMPYMRCQEPSGGPSQAPISLREAETDQPCAFFAERLAPLTPTSPQQGSGVAPAPAPAPAPATAPAAPDQGSVTYSYCEHCGDLSVFFGVKTNDKCNKCGAEMTILPPAIGAEMLQARLAKSAATSAQGTAGQTAGAQEVGGINAGAVVPDGALISYCWGCGWVHITVTGQPSQRCSHCGADIMVTDREQVEQPAFQTMLKDRAAGKAFYKLETCKHCGKLKAGNDFTCAACGHTDASGIGCFGVMAIAAIVAAGGILDSGWAGGLGVFAAVLLILIGVAFGGLTISFVINNFKKRPAA